MKWTGREGPDDLSGEAQFSLDENGTPSLPFTLSSFADACRIQDLIDLAYRSGVKSGQARMRAAVARAMAAAA